MIGNLLVRPIKGCEDFRKPVRISGDCTQLEGRVFCEIGLSKVCALNCGEPFHHLSALVQRPEDRFVFQKFELQPDLVSAQPTPCRRASGPWRKGNSRSYSRAGSSWRNETGLYTEILTVSKASANGFIINNFDSDFVVVAKLNRGTAELRSPQFFHHSHGGCWPP